MSEDPDGPFVDIGPVPSYGANIPERTPDGDAEHSSAHVPKRAFAYAGTVVPARGRVSQAVALVGFYAVIAALWLEDLILWRALFRARRETPPAP